MNPIMTRELPLQASPIGLRTGALAAGMAIHLARHRSSPPLLKPCELARGGLLARSAESRRPGRHHRGYECPASGRPATPLYS